MSNGNVSNNSNGGEYDRATPSKLHAKLTIFMRNISGYPPCTQVNFEGLKFHH